MKSLNNVAWEQLFDKLNILNQVDSNGGFCISAAQIKEFREPRLMTKFDHMVNLPQIFADNQLSILPITRGDYLISHFAAYHKFEDNCSPSPIKRVTLPSYIQSLDANNIPSEAIALNCAIASGIIADFLEDENLLATVSGRMSSGNFHFTISDLRNNSPHRVNVSNSQIEIDAAYEGLRCLALIEAKRDLADDFLIRQLYYPYRTWKNRIIKGIRTIFLVYSNGIYHLYEYMFQDPENYNSLVLLKQGNYSIEDTAINVADIQDVLNTTNLTLEPEMPFPQADNFERVINLCELLYEQDLSRIDVTEQYAFDSRQTDYYTDAARYLGCLEKYRDQNDTTIYTLSETGKRILNLNFKQRQLAYCGLILSHRPFAETLKQVLDRGGMLAKDEIIQIMKDSNLYRIQSDTTFERRAFTIKGWINWILGLINE